LDLGQHLIEGVGQNAYLVAAHFVCADGVVVVICNRTRGASKPENWIRNETQKLTGKNEREKERGDENQSKDTAVQFQQLRCHRTQVGQEVESSFARAAKHHWLGQEDAIAVDPETRS